MDRFEELKGKYVSVFAIVQQQGVRLAQLHVQENKLFMRGTAPSEAVKNAVWNQIKTVNPAYDDIIADFTVDSTTLPQPSPASAPKRTYRVQPGDSLSKIAKEFYGNPNDYMRIFDANRGTLNDPNKIEAGQELVIPVGR